VAASATKGQRSRLPSASGSGYPHRHGREYIDQEYSGAMSEVRRLVTVIDLDDRDSRGRSVRARHEAKLADGRRVVLLDDRGWSSSAPVDDRTTKEVEGTARTVVGPDEPWGDQTREAVPIGILSSTSSRVSTLRMLSSERSHTTSR
jgi:hypothetical protein